MTLPADFLNRLLSEPESLEIHMVTAWNERFEEQVPSVISNWFNWFYKKIIPGFLQQIFAFENGQYWIIKEAETAGKDPIELALEYLDEAAKEYLSTFPDSAESTLIKNFVNNQFNKVKTNFLEKLKHHNLSDMDPKGLHLVLNITTRTLHPERVEPGQIFDKIKTENPTISIYPKIERPNSLARNIKKLFTNKDSNESPDTEPTGSKLDIEEKVKKLSAILADIGLAKFPLIQVLRLVDANIVTQNEVEDTKVFYQNYAGQLFDFLEKYIPLLNDIVPEQDRANFIYNIIISYVQNGLLAAHNNDLSMAGYNESISTEDAALLNVIKAAGLVSNPFRDRKTVEKIYSTRTKRTALHNLVRFFDETQKTDGVKLGGRVFDPVYTTHKPKAYTPIPESEYLMLSDILEQNFDEFINLVPTVELAWDIDHVKKIVKKYFQAWIEHQYLLVENFFNESDLKAGETNKSTLHKKCHALLIKCGLIDDDGTSIVKSEEEFVESYFKLVVSTFSSLIEEQRKNWEKINKRELNDAERFGLDVISTQIAKVFFECRLGYLASTHGITSTKTFNQKAIWDELLSADFNLTPCSSIPVRFDTSEIRRTFEFYWKNDQIVPTSLVLEKLGQLPLSQYFKKEQAKFFMGFDIENSSGQSLTTYIQNLYNYLYNPNDNTFAIHIITRQLLPRSEIPTDAKSHNQTEDDMRNIITKNLIKIGFPTITDQELYIGLSKCERSFQEKQAEQARQERDSLLDALREFAKLGDIEIIEDIDKPGTYKISSATKDFKSAYIREITLKVASLIIGEESGAYRVDRPYVLLDKAQKIQLLVAIKDTVYKSSALEPALTKIGEHRNERFDVFVAGLKRLLNVVISTLFGRPKPPVLIMETVNDPTAVAEASTASQPTVVPISSSETMKDKEVTQEDLPDTKIAAAKTLAVSSPLETMKDEAVIHEDVPNKKDGDVSAIAGPSSVSEKGVSSSPLAAPTHAPEPKQNYIGLTRTESGLYQTLDKLPQILNAPKMSMRPKECPPVGALSGRTP